MRIVAHWDSCALTIIPPPLGLNVLFGWKKYPARKKAKRTLPAPHHAPGVLGRKKAVTFYQHPQAWIKEQSSLLRWIALVSDGAQGAGYKVKQLRAKIEMTHVIAELLILTAWLETVNTVSETNEAKEMEKVTFSNNVISKRIDDMSDDTDNSDPGVY